MGSCSDRFESQLEAALPGHCSEKYESQMQMGKWREGVSNSNKIRPYKTSQGICIQF